MNNYDESVTITIRIAQIYAIVIAIIGGVGNFITISSIINEISINKRQKLRRRYITNQMISQNGKNLSHTSSLDPNHKPNNLIAMKTISLATCQTISSTINSSLDKCENEKKSVPDCPLADIPFSNRSRSLPIRRQRKPIFSLPRRDSDEIPKNQLKVLASSPNDFIKTTEHINMQNGVVSKRAGIEAKNSGGHKIIVNSTLETNFTNIPKVDISSKRSAKSLETLNVNKLNMTEKNECSVYIRKSTNNISVDTTITNSLECKSNANDKENNNSSELHTERRKQFEKKRRQRSFDALEELPKIPQMRKTSKKVSLLKCDRGTMIILSLCATDFVYCTINLPLTVLTYNYYYLGEYPPEPFCATAAFLRYVIAFAEWLTVGFLSIERCINLKRYRKAKLFSPLQTMCCIACIWMFSMAVQMPAYIDGRFSYDNRTFKCDYVCKDGRYTDKLYFFTLLLFIPCCLVLVGCISIMIQILDNRKNLIRHGISARIIEQRRKETKYSIAIVSGLLLLFLVCVLPISVNDTMYALDIMEGKYPRTMFKTKELVSGIVSYMIYWIQYAVNFIVYAVSNPCFRIAFRNLYSEVKDFFSCRKCRNYS